MSEKSEKLEAYGGVLDLPERDVLVTRIGVVIIFALTLIFALMDLTPLHAHAHEGICVPARVGRTALVALLAWFTGRRGNDRWDSILIALAMLTAFIGDVYLVAECKLVLGMGFFAGVQVLLSVRHARSILWLKRQPVPVWPVVLAFLGSIVVWAALFPLTSKTPFLLNFTLFLGLLTLSLGLAWGQVIRGGWQSPDDLECALGMSLFYLCDVSFGTLNAMNYLDMQDMARFPRLAVDLAYSPALVLLVLSAHNWPVGLSRWMHRLR